MLRKLVTLALLLSVTVARDGRAECNAGIRAPSGMAAVGTSTATDQSSGTITVGPGGPVYVRVKNVGVSVSMGVILRRKGASALQAYCHTAALLDPDEEYWLEAKYAGDALAERDVDVVTGVEGATLKVTVFKAPNVLPTTLTDAVTIRMRAFIPNVHPGNPDYVRPVPGANDKSMIPGPVREATAKLNIDYSKDCFLTDNRGFSADRRAAAKLETEFRIVIYHGQVSVEPSQESRVHRAGASVRINCSTGEVLAEKPGSFDPPFGVRALGQPAVAGAKVQIIGQASVGNPHFVLAPNIDYSFDLVYDAQTKQLMYAITVGAFPAFEAYAFRGDAAPLPLLRLSPAAESAWGLTDGGLGMQTVRYTGTIQL